MKKIIINKEEISDLSRLKEISENSDLILSTFFLVKGTKRTFAPFSKDSSDVSIIEYLKDENLDFMIRKNPKIISINTDLIRCIVGQEEMKALAVHEDFDVSNLVLISIQDPDDKEDLSIYHSRFKRVLSVRFWDVEDDLMVKSGGYDVKPLNDDIASEIADFIAENIDEQFFVHCAAGVSRSAGVGLAVECISKFRGDKYSMAISPSEITNHFRYSPNFVVYDKIIDNIDPMLVSSYKYECNFCKCKFDKHIFGLKNGKETKVCPNCYAEVYNG